MPVASSSPPLFTRTLQLGALLNVGQKLVSFALNQALVRWTSPEVFGMASVQLELLLSTMLFLSREGIRLALLREKLNTRAQVQRFVNLSWLPSAILCLISVGLAVWGAVQQTPSSAVSRVSFLYCVGAVLEAAGEPWVNMFQNQAELVPKMKAESVGVLVKSAVTFLCVAFLGLEVVGFGIAQIAYGLVYLLVLISHTTTIQVGRKNCVASFKEFLPRFVSAKDDDEPEQGTVFGRRAISIAFSAFGSSVLKHFLTEGDKIFLSLTQSHYDQGIYALANNYASLIVRVLFLPLEDSSRVAFSKLSQQITTQRDTRHSREALHQSRQLFARLLRFVGLIGMVFPLFGPSYVKLAVRYAFNTKWRGTEIEQTLVAFCFYIFVLGINGISEAFVHVVTSAGGFGRINTGLVVSFLIYAVFSTLLVPRVGTCGVVYAGTFAMIARIVSSILFLQRFVGISIKTDLASLIPNMTQVVTVAVSSLTCYVSSVRYELSEKQHRNAMEHFAAGATIFITLVIFHRNSLKTSLKLEGVD